MTIRSRDWLATRVDDAVDASLPTPLYHQIRLVLRDAIRRGDLAAGTLLPGEIELADRFGVSRITVKRALNELAAEALVTRHRGRGTFVTDAPPPAIVHGSYDTLLASLKAMGHGTDARVLELANVVPSDAIADLLELARGTRVQRAVRLRTLRDGAFSHLVSYVPPTIAATYTRKELSAQPLLALLERAGVRIDGAEQWITAVAADPPIARALDVDAGAPLLKIERLMRDAAGTPVELVHAHYRPDRFVYFVRQRGLSKPRRTPTPARRSTAAVAPRRPRRA